VLRRISPWLAFLTAALLPATGGSVRRAAEDRDARDVSAAEADPFSVPAAGFPDTAPVAHASPFAAGPPVRPLHWAKSAEGSSAAATGRRTRTSRELILTFDDGPDLGGTPPVLEELDRRGLRAIFFVNGQHMVGSRPEDFARRDLVRRIAAQGHLVANHTLSHRNVCAEQDVLEQEIDGNAEIIAGATGLRPLLFRSPYGARCRKLDQALAERELLLVGWNLDPQEWKGGSEDAIVDYVTSRLARSTGRAVLLLHDTQRPVARALARILDWIDADNARAVRAGTEPLAIRDYSVFLPAAPLPPTWLEPFGDRIAAALGPMPAQLAAALGPRAATAQVR
jgi:peptidoglycan/xylan/chitin deacetylase (PgdA/CDA1 family)